MIRHIVRGVDVSAEIRVEPATVSYEQNGQHTFGIRYEGVVIVRDRQSSTKTVAPICTDVMRGVVPSRVLGFHVFGVCLYNDLPRADIAGQFIDDAVRSYLACRREACLTEYEEILPAPQIHVH